MYTTAKAVGRIENSVIVVSKKFPDQYIIYNPFCRKMSIVSQDPRADEGTRQKLIDCGQFTNIQQKVNFGLSITFSICDDCNLNCIYCFGGETRSTKKMHFSDAKKYIDKLFAENVNKRDVQVGFFGSGEPTLNMQFIMETVEYVKKQDLPFNVYYMITTNCTMQREDLEFMLTHNFYICASVDGPSFIQDFHRPFISGRKSSEKVYESLKVISERTGKFHVRATITSESVYHMSDIVTFLHSHGVKNIYLEPISLSGNCKENPGMLPSPEIFFESFVKAVETAEQLGVSVNSEGVRKLTVLSGGYYCSSIGGTTLVLTSDLKRSYCHEVLSGVKGDVFIDDDFTVESINRGVDPFDFKGEECYSGCDKCPVSMICNGTCPYRAWSENKSFAKPYSWQCKLSRLMIPFGIEKIAEKTINN